MSAEELYGYKKVTIYNHIGDDMVKYEKNLRGGLVPRERNQSPAGQPTSSPLPPPPQEVMFNIGQIGRVDYVVKFRTTSADDIRKVATLEVGILDFDRWSKLSCNVKISLSIVPFREFCNHVLLKDL